MKSHWLDTNVFIQAKNGPYGFDILPSFWDWVEDGIKRGHIKSPNSVCGELEKQKDEIARWASKMKRGGQLFVPSDRDVQMMIGKIGVFVNDNFDAPHAAAFLSGADPWVIAHAYVNKGVVVTHETLGGLGCKAVKIPNVCLQFTVDCMGTYDALRSLGMKI